MQNSIIRPRLPRVALAILLLSTQVLHAQQPVDTGGLYAVRVKGLTSATRDAVNQELLQRGQAKLLYACVPAGILVFAPMAQASRTQLRDHVSPALGRRTATRDITEVPLTMAQAEEQCAQARTR